MPNAITRTNGTVAPPSAKLLPAYVGLIVRKSALNASCASSVSTTSMPNVISSVLNIGARITRFSR